MKTLIVVLVVIGAISLLLRAIRNILILRIHKQTYAAKLAEYI